MSARGSLLELHGSRFTRAKRGREHSDYPVYYSGPVEDAPYLPPTVIFRECTLAAEDLERARDQIHAAFDWAPGGAKYEWLREHGEGARAYKVLYSKQQAATNGQQCRTGLAQAPAEVAEADTDLL